MSILLLEVIALVAYSAYGRRLGLTCFWQQCLAGVAVPGLVLGLVANFRASLITPLAFGMLAVAILLTLFDGVSLFRKRESVSWKSPFTRADAFALALAVAFLAVNIPVNRYVEIDGIDYVFFDQHEAYFAGQCAEMLNADYPERLRISNYFDHHWSRFHFFNSGCLASLMVLLPVPSLDAWHTGVLVYAVAGYLLVMRQLTVSSTDEPWVMSCLKIAAITGLLLSLFYPWFHWCTVTTSYFSMLSAIVLLFSLYRGDDRAALVFLVLFSSSTSRNLIGGVLACSLFLFWYFLTAKDWREELKRFFQPLTSLRQNYLFYGLVLVSASYSFATLFLGRLPESAALFAMDLGETTSANVSSVAKSVLDLFAANDRVGLWGELFVPFPSAGGLPFMLAVGVMLLLATAALLRATWSWIRWLTSMENVDRGQKISSVLMVVGTLALPMTYALFVPSNGTLRDLFQMSPLLFLLIIFELELPLQLPADRNRRLLLASLTFVVLFLSYTALPYPIKGSLAVSTTNSLFLAWIIIRVADLRVRWIEMVFCVTGCAFVLFTTPATLATFSWTLPMGHQCMYLPVEDIPQTSLKRAELFHWDDISPDANIADYLCAVHAARLRGHKSFMTNRFVGDGQWEEQTWVTDEWKRLQARIRAELADRGRLRLKNRP